MQDKVVPHDREIDDHKADKGSKVHHFSSFLEVEIQSTQQLNTTHEQDAVDGRSELRVNVAENAIRQESISPHAVEQSRRTGLPRDSAGDPSNQQDEGNKVKERDSANSAA